MTFPKIEEALTAHWGERCNEHEPGCPVCDAWAEYDNLCQRPTVAVKPELVNFLRFCLSFTDRCAGEGFRLDHADPYVVLSEFWDSQGWDVSGPEWVEDVLAAVQQPMPDTAVSFSVCLGEKVGGGVYPMSVSEAKYWREHFLSSKNSAPVVLDVKFDPASGADSVAVAKNKLECRV